MSSRRSSFGVQSGDLAEALDLSEPPSPLLDAVKEHLRHFQDNLPTVSETDDEDDASYTSDLEDQHQSSRAGGPSRTRGHPRTSPRLKTGHQRSSSAPVKPLKSAFAKSPPSSPPEVASGTATPKKKHARFVDDPTSSELSLRRTSTAPDSIAVPTIHVSIAGSANHHVQQTPWPLDEPSTEDRVIITRRESSSDEGLKDALEDEMEDAEAEMAEEAAIREAADPFEKQWSDDDSSSENGEQRKQGYAVRAKTYGDDCSPSTESTDSETASLEADPPTTRVGTQNFEPQGLLRAHEDHGPMALPYDQQDEAVGTEFDLSPVISMHNVITSAPVAATAAAQRPKHYNVSRSSDSQAADQIVEPAKTEPRRASSMGDFQRLKGCMKLRPVPPKAGPAGVALTATSVRAAEQPKLNPIYEHPAARWRYDACDGRPIHTEQTVYSGSSKYQVVWEEPSHSEADSDVTLLEGTEECQVYEPEDSITAHVSRSPSPMGKVKTKLAAWSWAREQDQDDDSHLIPAPPKRRHSASRSPGGSEGPPAPPNTEKSCKSGTSSAQRSAPQTPFSDDDEDDEDEDGSVRCEGDDDTGDVGVQVNVEDADAGNEGEDRESPQELHLKPFSRTRSATMPATMDYLSVPQGRHRPPVQRNWSNLAAEDEHFKTHRNTVDLYHRHLNESKMNEQLMSTRDSFLLAKSRYDARHPKAAVAGPAIQYSRFGSLSPILDASPPDARIEKGVKAMSKLARKIGAREEELPHPDEHVGCAIYEVERPRWFEANVKRKGQQA